MQHNTDICWVDITNKLAILDIRQDISTNIYLELHLCPFHKKKSNILSPFTSAFGLNRLLKELTGSLATKCSTMFTRELLTFSICRCPVFPVVLIKIFQ